MGPNHENLVFLEFQVCYKVILVPKIWVKFRCVFESFKNEDGTNRNGSKFYSTFNMILFNGIFAPHLCISKCKCTSFLGPRSSSSIKHRVITEERPFRYYPMRHWTDMKEAPWKVGIPSPALVVGHGQNRGVPIRWPPTRKNADSLCYTSPGRFEEELRLQQKLNKFSPSTQKLQ